MPVSIPRVQTTDRLINQLQTNIISGLQPITQNPLLSGNILSDVSLVAGTNAIPHGLGVTLTGWFVVRLRASSTIYDLQNSNQTPAVTLVLNASAPAIVDLYVF